MPRPKEVGKGGGGNSGEERAEEAGAFAWPFVEGMPLHGGSLVCVCVCVCVCVRKRARERNTLPTSLLLLLVVCPSGKPERKGVFSWIHTGLPSGACNNVERGVCTWTGKQNIMQSWAWWYVPIIPSLEAEPGRITSWDGLHGKTLSLKQQPNMCRPIRFHGQDDRIKRVLKPWSAGHQWLILVTQEVEIRSISIWSQPRQIAWEALSGKTLHKDRLVEWLKVKALSSSISTTKAKQNKLMIVILVTLGENRWIRWERVN
jgi:hypothetical protein